MPSVQGASDLRRIFWYERGIGVPEATRRRFGMDQQISIRRRSQGGEEFES